MYRCAVLQAEAGLKAIHLPGVRRLLPPANFKSVDRPLHIRGMQDLMRPLAARLSQILFIYLSDRRVLMGLPDRLCRIVIVQRFRPDCLHIFKIPHIRMHPGLAVGALA